MFFVIGIISFYLSLVGFASKAGHPFWYGLIPIFNLAIFFYDIEINPILLVLFGLGLIFLPDPMILVTCIYIFMPFLVSEAYGKGIGWGIVGLFMPFIIYPVIAYFIGEYAYSVEA